MFNSTNTERGCSRKRHCDSSRDSNGLLDGWHDLPASGPIHCHHLVLLKASPECELVHTRPRALLALFVVPPRNNSEDFDAYAAADPVR